MIIIDIKKMEPCLNQKEVMKNESICDRQDMTPVNEYRPGHWTLGNDNKGRQPGITFSQGNYWKEQRRFLL